jgi:outer membrane protein OmpA-like peptidoglycan-associated protein
MIERTTDRRVCARKRAPWLALLSAFALAACSATPDWANPVEWYKGATSIFDDESQPAPANEAAAEMAKKPIPGEGEPFPNLASVPERPKSVTPSGERQKITEALVSDRANARYVEPPPPREAPPARRPRETAPSLTPSPAPSVSSAPAEPPPPAGSSTASPPPSPVPPPAPSAASSRSAPGPIASAPSGEPPAPPKVAPIPAPEASSAAGAPRGPSRVVVEPSGEVKNAQAQASTAAGAQATAPTGHIPGTVPMAVVLFNEGGTQISAEQRQGLGAVVREANARGASVRVVGHTSPPRDPNSSASLVNNFHVAMDRAQSVASALIRLGLPAARVRVEADTSPASVPDVGNVPQGDAGMRRADVFLE